MPSLFANYGTRRILDALITTPFEAIEQLERNGITNADKLCGLTAGEVLRIIGGNERALGRIRDDLRHHERYLVNEDPSRELTGVNIKDAVNYALRTALGGDIYGAMRIIEKEFCINTAERELRGWRGYYKRQYSALEYSSIEEMLTGYANAVVSRFGRKAGEPSPA